MNVLTVEFVKEGSPAALAGLRGGDRLISVNGHPVASILKLRQMLGGSPTGDWTLRVDRPEGEFVCRVPGLADGKLGARFSESPPDDVTEVWRRDPGAGETALGDGAGRPSKNPYPRTSPWPRRFRRAAWTGWGGAALSLAGGGAGWVASPVAFALGWGGFALAATYFALSLECATDQRWALGELLRRRDGRS